ncbi:MAG: glucose-6-phosphate isomerase family protein [Chloroflexota bacterium]
MNFQPGFDIHTTSDPLGFAYGPGVFGPRPESRTLDSIRKSLLDPTCLGPDIVYAIAMDVGKEAHRADLEKRMLLYGAVTYAAGKLGREPVRSQGHIHKVSQHSGWSPPEVYEIWHGRAIILMQESATDDPGRCFAVDAGPGDVVVVPPRWAHMTISADPASPLAFGAWCDREYGFAYDDVRAHGGLAWFPVYEKTAPGKADRIAFEANPRYRPSTLVRKLPAAYSTLGIAPGVPIYRQYEDNPETFQFVSRPHQADRVWEDFIP